MIKRLSGGLILLCLTSISLGVTSGEVSITDTDVLEQLKELRTFIDVNRDFSKGFKNLKPVLIEYRSSASKFNGIALGNLSFNTDALHMSIGINTIQADGKMLIVTINVVYEWEDYIGYKVKSAKLTAYETLATGDGTFTGDVGVGGDLEVTDDASVGGDLSVTGNAVLPSINGETNPSVKPIYYHPVVIWGKSASTYKSWSISLVALTNFVTAFGTIADFIDWIETNNITYLAPASGSIYASEERFVISWIDITYEDDAVTGFAIRCQGVNTDAYLQQVNISVADLEESFNISDTGVNKIN